MDAASCVPATQGDTPTATRPAMLAGSWTYVLLSVLALHCVSAGVLADPHVDSINPVSAAPGTLLEVHGHGYPKTAQQSQVLFGTGAGQIVAATTVRVVNDTLITCVVPLPAAAPHDPLPVLVRVDGSQSALNPQATFKYSGTPAVPKITHVKPAKGVAGDLVTISGTGFYEAASADAVFATTAAAATVVSTNEIHVKAPSMSHAQLPDKVDVRVKLGGHGSKPGKSAHFTYLPNGHLTTGVITPSHGACLTNVTVHGSGFFRGESAQCIWHVAQHVKPVPVRAVVVNSTAVMCRTPLVSWGHGPPPRATAVVKIGTYASPANPETVYQYDRADVAAVSPSHGREGTFVAVTGAGFYPASQLELLFGKSLHVTATYVNATTLTCVAPKPLPGMLDVVVSAVLDGQHTPVQETPVFTFDWPPVRMQRLTPRLARVDAAIRVDAENLESASSATCVFGDVPVSGSIVKTADSKAHVVCLCPGQEDPTRFIVNVTLVVDRRCSVNALPFVYDEAVRVTNLVPAIADAGVLLTVTGRHFVDAEPACVFGGDMHHGHRVPAVFVSSTTLLCHVPRQLALPGRVRVSVTLAGIVSSADPYGGDMFQYEHDESRAPTWWSVLITVALVCGFLFAVSELGERWLKRQRAATAAAAVTAGYQPVDADSPSAS